MAEFLKQQIYHRDGIQYFSRKQDILAEKALAGDFARAVLHPSHPLVVHGETRSQNCQISGIMGSYSFLMDQFSDCPVVRCMSYIPGFSGGSQPG